MASAGTVEAHIGATVRQPSRIRRLAAHFVPSWAFPHRHGQPAVGRELATSTLRRVAAGRPQWTRHCTDHRVASAADGV